jgi:hypothetical protein
MDKILKLSPKFHIGNINGWDFYKLGETYFFIVDDEHEIDGDNFLVIENAETVTKALEIFLDSVTPVV